MSEYTKIIQLKVYKNGVGVDSASGASTTRQFAQTGQGAAKFAQTISHTGPTAILIPSEVGTPCHMVMKNPDASNKVTFSVQNGGTLGSAGTFDTSTFTELDPNGDEQCIKVTSGKTLYAQASGGSDIQCQFTVGKP